MNSVTDQPVKTFSIGFAADSAGYNELQDARLVAQYFGTDHHEWLLTEQDLVNVLDDLVYQYDEPFGDAASFPTYLLSRFARMKVPVALSGEGSDELFGGYRRYVAEKWGGYYRELPHALTNGVLKGIIGLASRSHKAKKALQIITNEEPVSRYTSWFSLFNDDMRAQLFSPAMVKASTGLDSLEVYRRYYPGNGTSEVGKALYLDQRLWLPDTYLEKVDKASMAVGLETRVPFLDHELVEFSATIPVKYKVRGATTKYILKRALKGLLPPATLKKPKSGFTPPTELWFKGNLKGLVQDVLFDSQARSRGFFNTDYIRSLYQQHCEGRGLYHRHLWLLIVFEIWCRRYGINA
jgi:asparagine synthase (glutamine-hydrolysing)